MPRIWRPTDDISGLYTKARESTVQLIPQLSRFHLSATSAPPPLDAWIGGPPASASASAVDDEDLPPIGGVDGDAGKSLDDEMVVLSEAKQRDLLVRFRKTADGVYVEARRSAIGGVSQVPLWFYGALLALGWNEIVAGESSLVPSSFQRLAMHAQRLTATVLRNPVYTVFLVLLAVAAYVTYTLNLWGPMARMANAASQQAVDVGKERLREFLEMSETGRAAVEMSTDAASPTSPRSPGRRGADADADADLDELDREGSKAS